jgi:hypothetical protein
VVSGFEKNFKELRKKKKCLWSITIKFQRICTLQGTMGEKLGNKSNFRRSMVEIENSHGTGMKNRILATGRNYSGEG